MAIKMWCIRPACVILSSLLMDLTLMMWTRPVLAIAEPASQRLSQVLPPSVSPPLNADPNRDRFPQPIVSPHPLPPASGTPLVVPPPVAPSSTPASEAQIEVTRIEVKGSTVFPPERLQVILNPLQGRSVRLAELQHAADAITQLYLDQGYITSRAILVDQTIQAGVVQIQVIEGKLAEIEVRGNRRVKSQYITRRIRLSAATPLKPQRIEDQLRLLKDNPLFTSVEGSLKPGKNLGETNLVVQVTEAPAPFFAVFVDNNSPPDVGSERLGGVVGARNLSGYGDAVGIALTRSTNGGALSSDWSYQLPVNAREGNLLLRATLDNTRITNPSFASFDIQGSSERYEISFRQPILRSSQQEFALSAGFTYQSSQTFLFQNLGFPFGIGPDANGVSTTSVLKLGQDYLRRDRQGAWMVRSQLNLGTGLFNATQNPAPIPDGQFLSWIGQAQRVQVIGTDRLLILSSDLQLTPNSLLPQQQFVIGGMQSVRGFRQNSRTGDNGARFSVEARLPIQRNEGGKAIALLAPFLDAGIVWNQANNPNALPRQTFLAGTGLGVLWEPLPRWTLRLDYGFPLVNLSDRGDNLQDAGLYFSVNYHSR